MASHSLNFEVIDTMNKCILKILDFSIYSNIVPYVCPTVQVLLPGFNTAIVFNDTTTPQITKGFDLNITACDLAYQTSNCGNEYMTLPDGVYAIKYSVSPNAQLFNEQNHLRITNIMHIWKEEMCKLNLVACEPIPETKEKFQTLMEIKGYIEAAKASVEWCLNADKGMSQYNYAKKLLDRFTCSNC